MNVGLFTMADDKYLEPLSNMIFSFLYNNKWFSDAGYDIVILNDDGKMCRMSDEGMEAIRKIYPNIKRMEVIDDVYDKIVEHQNRITMQNLYMKHCYYKFELFKRDGYTHKLWLDADVIVNGNLSEMINDFSFSGCQDLGYETKLSNSFLARQHHPLDYYNMGVFTINDNICGEEFYNRLINFALTMSNDDWKKEVDCDGKYIDQDIINSFYPLMEKSVSLNPFIYNYNPHAAFSTGGYQEVAKILHFFGWHKPWKCNTPLSDKDMMGACKIYYLYDYLRRKKQ